MAEPTHAPPPDTAANVRELRATIVALRRLLSIGSLDEALPAASRVPALKLTTDALAVLERFLEGTHSIQAAALALACRMTGIDVDGKPYPPECYSASPAEHARKTTASLEAFASAIVEAAVQAATLAAPRVRACSRCDHLMEDRLKFLDEIEGLRMENAALRGRLEATRCACGGSRPPEVLTADLLPAVSPCRCVESGVHTACVGHCPESAARSRARDGGPR